ncbi:MAG TPA: hypothetical protein VGI22_28330 [Xanthobacteraceae bacterium]
MSNRQRLIAYIFEVRTTYSPDHRSPILFPAPDDPAWLERVRDEIEAMPYNDLLLEAVGWSLRLGERDEDDLSWLECERKSHHQAISRIGGKEAAQKRRQRRLDIIAKGRRLYAKTPKLQADRAYDLLELDGIIACSSFKRWFWKEIIG